MKFVSKIIFILIFICNFLMFVNSSQAQFSSNPATCSQIGDPCCSNDYGTVSWCANNSGLIPDKTNAVDCHCIQNTSDLSSCAVVDRDCCVINGIGVCQNPLVCRVGKCIIDNTDYSSCSVEGGPCCYPTFNTADGFCTTGLYCTPSYPDSVCLSRERSIEAEFPNCNQDGDECCAGNICAPGLNCDSGQQPHICKASLEEKYVFFVCNNIPTDNPNKAQCEYCLQRNGIWTAVGCLNYSVDGFIQNILQLAIGLGGGIALLLMIFGAFKISASAGDPKAAQSGKEVFGGAIAGLLIIIFSVFILNLIGVEIIKIPGF